MALNPATPAPMTKTLLGGIFTVISRSSILSSTGNYLSMLYVSQASVSYCFFTYPAAVT